MGAVPQKVLNWMYNVLKGEYRHPDRTYSDVAHSLTQYPQFSLRTNVYTYENGHPALLLNIAGNLPVSFRGTVYMFPISIWMPHEYPHEVPMVFVIPTKSMAIRPGQYVSGEGRVYHPYLAEWRDDRSNLTQLVSILQAIFAREPPLIAKRDEPSQAQLQSMHSGLPPPVPPLPPELDKSQSTTTLNVRPPPPPPKTYNAESESPKPHLNSPHRVPPLPPKPSNGYGVEISQRNSIHGAPEQPPPLIALQRTLSQRYNHNIGPSAGLLDHRGFPALPRHEDRGSFSPTATQETYPSGSSAAQRAASSSEYSKQAWATPLLPNGAAGRNAGQGTWEQQMPYRQHQQQQPTPKQPPPNHPPSSIPNQLYPQQPSSQQQHRSPQPQPPLQTAFKPKPPAPDLLTSPFDTALPTSQPAENVPPPPIPPNPQKDALLSTISTDLTSRIHSTHASNASALPALQAQHIALSNTLANLNQETASLTSLEDLLSSNERILHRSMADADTVLQDAKSRPVPNVDEVLVAGAVVERQLYECVCEERAIGETRAFLGRALDRGRIGGEAWARATRGLAREEFGKRWLGQKIARGMGLRMEEEKSAW